MHTSKKQTALDIILKYFADFNDTQLQQLQQLEELYKHWNEQINVISRKDIDSLYERHVLHSLSIAVLCNFEPGTQVVDIGTGGGFPGIPLAIFFPEVNFLLTDSIGKKIKVVNEVANAIGLKNVTAVHSRVEDIKGRTFDYAVSRAVAPLGDLWRWVNPLLRPGQMSEELPNGLICLKGGDLDKEITESGLKEIVQAWEVDNIFDEESFREKYVIYVPKK
ncbi:16S rRNA (guanine(527)-N(7))-methyltransferase RsmG [Flavipsychrobacter stenotrophus]|uniref:Ribosomal RNA small subunit methyltransferase G n=1 Tax=Flavipsychrobacter stenotrophus TaxID=2077091 RepID=A0A2S7SWP8_9BACT|nr:16S rRNA (guanine(527)-N(7))-methyltransferase RsmG [Flavipsychrobacter stenotrophus]